MLSGQAAAWLRRTERRYSKRLTWLSWRFYPEVVPQRPRWSIRRAPSSATPPTGLGLGSAHRIAPERNALPERQRVTQAAQNERAMIFQPPPLAINPIRPCAFAPTSSIFTHRIICRVVKRNPGGLPAAGRQHQRQAHRGHLAQRTGAGAYGSDRRAAMCPARPAHDRSVSASLRRRDEIAGVQKEKGGPKHFGPPLIQRSG